MPVTGYIVMLFFMACRFNPCLQNYREPLLDPTATNQLANDLSSNDDQEPPLDLKDVIYQLNCFFAVLWPVCVTILASSIIVSTVADPVAEEAMKSYMYYQDLETSDLSDGQKTLRALVNASCVIVFIALLTFIIVALYKFNCIKVFHAYCILYCGMLLALTGSKLALTILVDKLGLIVDMYSFGFIMFNFAMVGTLSIFFQKGIPAVFEQGYLVFISAMVAWQISQLPEWSVWALLLLLAFWDMFAVLSPFGPLNCLVNLIQEKGTPVPGLIFEAQVQDAHMDSSSPKSKALYASLAMNYGSENDFLTDLLVIGNGFRHGKANWRADKVHALRAQVLGFQMQVSVFLRDVSSSFQCRASDLATLFLDHQLTLWRKLYQFYRIHHVTADKPYPSVHHVFPRLDMIELQPQQQQQQLQQQQQDDDDESKSIKLGLGDFIFYSVLTARAAVHGIACFAACFLSIMMGLAFTMYLLARYEALPALPLPILLAIAAFLLCTQVLDTYLDMISLQILLY